MKRRRHTPEQVLGGFTTFSTFFAQAVLEVDAGEPGRAFAYVVASVIGGLLAASVGDRGGLLAASVGYALGRSLA